MELTQNKKNKWAEESGSYSHISDTRELINVSDSGVKYAAGYICKYCREHEQLSPELAHDCKVLIYDTDKNGKIITLGQCNCYAKEHGLRH